MTTFFNKFKKRKNSADQASLGSNSSLFRSGEISITPYTVNEKQLPPFLKAVWKNDLSKVKKLMKKNYSTVDKENRTGFHLACASGNIDIIKELIGNFSNELLEKRDSSCKTGIFKAVEKGILENVQYLHEKGARIDIKDDNGDSLIHAAIKYKHINVLNYLLNKDVDPNATNKEQNTPFHLAAELNFVDGIRMLLEFSDEINKQNNSGKTPLIIAAESGFENTIKILLKNNANKSINDSKGYNALYYAGYHQLSECIKLLQDFDDLKVQVTPQKHSVTLEAPEFLTNLESDNQHSQKSPNSNGISQHDVKSRKSDPSRQNQSQKQLNHDSIRSNSTWKGDCISTSSEATIPESQNSIPIYDISTPSSMLNPSENIINKVKPNLHRVYDQDLKKELSDDEESHWSDNDNSRKEVELPIILNKPVEKKKDHEKNTDDDDWDSDDTEHQNVQIDLSTIDEESGEKRCRLNSQGSLLIGQEKQVSELEKSELSLPDPDDGHQTDSNIEECVKNNNFVTRPAVRCDSIDGLDNSTDDDNDEFNELIDTQRINTNYKESTQTPMSKPPKSPASFTVDRNIPTITIQDVTPKKRTKHNKLNSDNLSYSSTEFDVNSRTGSLAESDSLTDYKKSTFKSIDEYIKKCAQLESKLRTVESERDGLQMKLNALNESKDKSESERLKTHKENQRLEAKLLEKRDELSEYKSKFGGAEEQLKKREKELLEIKRAKQEVEDKHSKLENSNISLNSKVKQLQQELEDFHSKIQYSQNIQEDAAQYKKKYEDDLKEWLERNDNLKSQINDLKKDLSKKDEEFADLSMEHNKKMENLLKQNHLIQESVEKEKEDKENLQEEIDQLRKTIKNLNSDLELSNKSMALATKQEKENKELKERIEALEKNCNKLTMDKENIAKSSSEKDQKFNNSQLEIDKLKNQLNLKDDRICNLEIQYKTYENQSKDLENILAKKNTEIREFENKLMASEMELKKEIKKFRNILDAINETINIVIIDHPDSSNLLEKLQNIKKSINSSEANPITINKQTNLASDDNNLIIELSKSKSQIKALQEQIESMKHNYNTDICNGDSEHLKKSFKKQNSNDEISSDIEIERIDKLENTEKQLHNDLQSKSRIIQSNHHELTQLDRENSELKEALKEEKQKYQFIQEKDKSLSNQLRNEIKKKKQLSETLDSVKYWLDKYSKQINLPKYSDDYMISSNIDVVDNAYSSLPNECSLLLQSLSDGNDDLKMKLKKTEVELEEINNRKSSSQKSQEIVYENSQKLLNQQLEEMTQVLENQRLNREKLERIRDENEFQLRNELYQIKQQTMTEVSQLNNKAVIIEDERDALIQQNKTLNEMLIKERQLKDSLTEQLVNLVKSSHGSNQQLNGFEPAFQANSFNPSLSQFSIPISLIDNERKGYANSMLNLSVYKSSGVEDEELRQKLRQDLDRCIAKHLEKGKPIRQLDIREKIRSLNNPRYPSTLVSWKSP